MSIRNHRFIGKYRKPDPKRVFRVFIGTDTETGASVRFINPNGSPVIIDPKEWPKWRKIPEIRPLG